MKSKTKKKLFFYFNSNPNAPCTYHLSLLAKSKLLEQIKRREILCVLFDYIFYSLVIFYNKEKSNLLFLWEEVTKSIRQENQI